MPKHRSLGLSLIELLLTLSVIALLGALLLPSIARAQEAAKRSLCQSNLKQWGLIFKLYSNESKGNLWPPLQARTPGTDDIFKSFSFSPLLDVIYPDYVTNLSLLSCPSDIDSLDNEAGLSPLSEVLQERPWISGRSYTYLGWILDKTNRPLARGGDFPALGLLSLFLGVDIDLSNTFLNAQLAAALDARLRTRGFLSLDPERQQLISNLDIRDVSPHPNTGEPLGNGAGNVIFRLREGVERFLLTDINSPGSAKNSQSGVWVMFDRSVLRGSDIRANHQPGGSNVLYFDGSVRYVNYEHGSYDFDRATWLDGPGTPPVTASIARTIGALSAAR